MKAFKWDKLKEDAIAYMRAYTGFNDIAYAALLQTIEDFILGEPCQGWRQNYEDYIKKGVDLIKRWDVRKSRSLFQAFPQILPKCYQNKPFRCEMGDKGEWYVVFE